MKTPTGTTAKPPRNSSTAEPSSCLSVVWRELAALVLLGLLTFALAWRFDLFARLVTGVRWLGALMVTTFVLTLALKVHASLRWHEAQRELAARIWAEESLHASEDSLRLLMQQFPAFLWTTDATMRLTSFTGGAFQRSGIDPSGHVGKTVAEFFSTADSAFPPIAAHRHALAGVSGEYALHHNGRDYEVRVEPLRGVAGATVGCLGLGIDVTERERAAAALRDSEARFRAIFEHAALGISLSDLSRRPLLVNPALAQFIGYDSVDETTRLLLQAIDPDDVAREQELYEELVADQRDSYQLEQRYRRKDNVEVWGQLATSLTRDSSGAPQYVISMVDEVTARVLAEAALRERESRFQAVVGQVAEGVFFFEAEGKRLQEANAAFLRLFGYDETELAVLTLYDLIAHDHTSIEANVRCVVSSGRLSISKRDYRRKDGTTVVVEVSAVALATTSNTPLVCVVVRDITTRQEAEDALRTSETRLRLVVENAPLLLFALDMAGIITFVAGRSLAVLGHTPGEVVGRSALAGDGLDPAVQDYVRRTLTGETVEARVVVCDLVFATHYAPLRDESGTVNGVIGVATDVTALARAEVERDLARRRAAAAREGERLALARELHDEPIQELLGIHLALQLGRDALCTAGDIQIAVLLDEGERAVREVVKQLRQIVSELRPAGLEELGLVAALEGYVAHLRRKEAGTALIIELDLDPAVATLPLIVARALFRVVQEGLRNVRRHAEADRAIVILEVNMAWAILHVEDDGRGFVPPPELGCLARVGHFGLVGIAEQLADLEGTLRIMSRPGVGTSLVAHVPLITGEGDDG